MLGKPDRNRPSGIPAMSDFIRFVTEYWYFAAPLFVAIFIGTGLILWRLLLNMQASTNLDNFLTEFTERLANQTVKMAIAFYRSRSHFFPSRLFVVGLESHQLQPAAIEQAMRDVIQREILPKLNFLLPAIVIVAKVATLAGLIANVFIMLGVFNAARQAGNPNVAPNEIGIALIATAMGLACGVPLIFAHILFRAWMVKYEMRMESAMQALMVWLRRD
jgi:biopolymer transport protein ExbB